MRRARSSARGGSGCLFMLSAPARKFLGFVLDCVCGSFARADNGSKLLFVVVERRSSGQADPMVRAGKPVGVAHLAS